MVFTVVYASNSVQERKLLWKQITNFSNNINNSYNSWVIGGDFNEILKSSEKIGGNNIIYSRSFHFWNCINSSGIIDLGFKGSKYT